MKIKEAWGIIAGFSIELVEQYSVKEYDRWRDAVQTMQKFLQPILDEPEADVVTTYDDKSGEWNVELTTTSLRFNGRYPHTTRVKAN